MPGWLRSQRGQVTAIEVNHGEVGLPSAMSSNSTAEGGAVRRHQATSASRIAAGADLLIHEVAMSGELLKDFPSPAGRRIITALRKPAAFSRARSQTRDLFHIVFATVKPAQDVPRTRSSNARRPPTKSSHRRRDIVVCCLRRRSGIRQMECHPAGDGAVTDLRAARRTPLCVADTKRTRRW